MTAAVGENTQSLSLNGCGGEEGGISPSSPKPYCSRAHLAVYTGGHELVLAHLARVGHGVDGEHEARLGEPLQGWGAVGSGAQGS